MKEKLKCIMMIDDDEPTNFISMMRIEEANCTDHIEIMESGLQALNYLENAGAYKVEKNRFIQPDLVFLDINMPCMNGWEFLDEYKNLKNTPLAKMVIIMLSTSLNPYDKLRAESILDVAGFENKPLTTEMIQRVIKKYFNGGSMQVIEATAMSD